MSPAANRGNLGIEGDHSKRMTDGSCKAGWRILLSSFIFPSAPIGERFDYRRKDEDSSKPWERSSWRDKVPSIPGLPISSSGIIILLCVIVYFIGLISPVFVYTHLALRPDYLMQEPWTLITYIFVHANFNHLFWNMLFLFFFGIELERRIGEAKFTGIFLLSGIVAAIGQILVEPSGTLVGASGALYGVMGCLAMIAPEIRVFLFFMIPMSIGWAIVLFAVIDFLMYGSPDNIAHAAHLSGLALGLAIGYVMRRQPRYYQQ